MAALPRIVFDKDMLPEILRRLINIERKLDWLLVRSVPMTADQAGAAIGDLGKPIYGPRSFAQHGDDMVLLNIFRMLGIEAPTWLDIGAHDPFKISNTALLYARGAHGINVEANPNLIEAFRTQRPRDITLNVGVAGARGTLTFHMFDALSGLNTFDAERARAIEAQGRFRVQERLDIPVVTVADILAEHWPQGFPDLLSLDVEGLDLEILQSIDYARACPKVICVEANSSEQGRQMKSFLKGVGYRLFFRASVNLFFLRAELVEAALTP